MAIFGMKRGEPRVGADAVELALDLTPEAITMHERAASGGWKKFATAALDDPEFQIVIGLLRTEAEGRVGGRLPVRLWLPGEQVLQHRTKIAGQDEIGRLRTAFDYIERETVFRPRDVAVAVAPSTSGGETTVLITFAETWREARDYATRWGFSPGEVSTRHRSGDFGADGPVFRLQQELNRPLATPPRRRFAVAAVVLGTIGLGALLWALNPDPSTRTSKGPAVATVSDPAPLEPAVSATRTEVEAPFSDDLPKPEAAVALPVDPADNLPEPVRATAEATIPTADDFAKAARKFLDDPVPDPGQAPDAVRWTGPIESLAAPTQAGEAPSPVPAAEPPPLERDPVTLWSGTPEKPTPPEFSIPREILETAIPMRLPVLVVVPSAPVDSSVPPIPVAIAQRIDAEPAPVEVEIETVTEVEVEATVEVESDSSGVSTVTEIAVAAPLPVPIPLPRPRRDGAEGALDENGVPPEAPIVMPPPRPARLTVTVDPAPIEAVQTTPPVADTPAPSEPPKPELPVTARTEVTEQETASAPAAAIEAEIDPDAPTAMASLVSPMPVARPARPVPARELTTITALPAITGTVPRSVRAAATEQGLPLDRTLLIGILNLDNGRKALLRLPDGRYRSVVVGDVLDGWSVSAIGTDAMRVSRSGEDHTLLLVNR